MLEGSADLGAMFFELILISLTFGSGEINPGP